MLELLLLLVIKRGNKRLQVQRKYLFVFVIAKRDFHEQGKKEKNNRRNMEISGTSILTTFQITLEL